VQTRAAGIVEGINKQDELRLSYISHLSVVHEGDEVLSSGQGLIFPRGFALGTISHCEVDGLYQKVVLKPCIDVTAIDFCYLLEKESVAGFDASGIEEIVEQEAVDLHKQDETLESHRAQKMQRDKEKTEQKAAAAIAPVKVESGLGVAHVPPLPVSCKYSQVVVQEYGTEEKQEKKEAVPVEPSREAFEMSEEIVADTPEQTTVPAEKSEKEGLPQKD